jgi:predicted lipoprotein
LLEVLAGKRQGQIVSALISNFSAAESSMDSMANSAGNAMQEMEVIYDSLDYKLNKLSETGTGIAQNLFKTDDMKTVVDVLNTLAGWLDTLTEKLGLFKTAALGIGAIAGIKNIGKCA